MKVAAYVVALVLAGAAGAAIALAAHRVLDPIADRFCGGQQ